MLDEAKVITGQLISHLFWLIDLLCLTLFALVLLEQRNGGLFKARISKHSNRP